MKVEGKAGGCAEPSQHRTLIKMGQMNEQVCMVDLLECLLSLHHLFTLLDLVVLDLHNHGIQAEDVMAGYSPVLALTRTNG